MSDLQIGSLKKIISSAIKISSKTYNMPCTRAQELAADFLTKNTMASLTIWNIINPKNISDFKVNNSSFKMYDLPSLYVVIRTLFEGYLNMNYILLDPESEEERELRLNLWDRHALYERKKMSNFVGTQNKKLKLELEKIEEYTNRIKNSPYVKKQPKNRRQSLIERHNWCKLKKVQLAKKANIHKSQAEFMYKFLSNYVHSDSYSLMQINSYDSVDTVKKFLQLPINFTEMSMSLTIDTFSKMIPKAHKIVNNDEELVKIILLWNNLKKQDLKKIYDANSV